MFQVDDDGLATHGILVSQRRFFVCVDAGVDTVPGTAAGESVAAPEPEVPVKRRYSAAELGAFRQDEALALTLFAAEKYFNRMLSSTETQTILYIYDELGFSADLLDYLLQYTAENAKGRFSSYMEKTAIGWRREGITSVEDVSRRATKHDKRYYEILHALGSDGTLTAAEETYFDRWLNEYAFSMDIILEACGRAVLTTQKNRIKYADGILSNWHAQGVRTAEDIVRADETHAKKASSQQVRTSSLPAPDKQIDTRNRFNRFRQHDYDFDAIRAQVVNNG